MAFSTAQLRQNNIAQPTLDATNQLSAQELVFLLDALKRTTFVGEQVETMFNTVLKLQNQYLEQTKQ
jgi:hypothetical protein